MIDGLPNRPLYFSQKDIIGSYPPVKHQHQHLLHNVGQLLGWRHQTRGAALPQGTSSTSAGRFPGKSLGNQSVLLGHVCQSRRNCVCLYFSCSCHKKRGFPKIGVPLKIICISRWEFPLQTIHYWGIAIDGHPHTRKRSWSFKIFKPSVQKFGLQATCFRMNIFFLRSIQSRPPFVKMNSSFVTKIQ